MYHPLLLVASTAIFTVAGAPIRHNPATTLPNTYLEDVWIKQLWRMLYGRQDPQLPVPISTPSPTSHVNNEQNTKHEQNIKHGQTVLERRTWWPGERLSVSPPSPTNSVDNEQNTRHVRERRTWWPGERLSEPVSFPAALDHVDNEQDTKHGDLEPRTWWPAERLPFPSPPGPIHVDNEQNTKHSDNVLEPRTWWPGERLFVPVPSVYPPMDSIVQPSRFPLVKKSGAMGPWKRNLREVFPIGEFCAMWPDLCEDGHLKPGVENPEVVRSVSKASEPGLEYMDAEEFCGVHPEACEGGVPKQGYPGVVKQVDYLTVPRPETGLEEVQEMEKQEESVPALEKRQMGDPPFTMPDVFIPGLPDDQEESDAHWARADENEKRGLQFEELLTTAQGQVSEPITNTPASPKPPTVAQATEGILGTLEDAVNNEMTALNITITDPLITPEQVTNETIKVLEEAIEKDHEEIQELQKPNSTIVEKIETMEQEAQATRIGLIKTFKFFLHYFIIDTLRAPRTLHGDPMHTHPDV